MESGFNIFLENGVLARYTAIEGNPNVLGLFALIATGLLIAFYFLEDFKSIKWKIVFSVLLINNIAIIVLIDSRAATIGLLMALVFFLYFINKRILLKGILFLSIFIAILYSIPYFRDLITIFLRLESHSVRVYLWTSGWEMFKDHLLHGVGPELFSKYFYTYFPSAMIELFREIGALNYGLVPTPHNFILLMASENGIPGFVMAISLFTLYFYLGIKSVMFFKYRNRDYFIIALSILSIGIGVFWRSFFEVSGIMFYGYMSQDLPFWILFIILFYLYKHRTELADENIITV